MTDSDCESKQLTSEILKKGLSNLGKTFNNARHAYLTLNISQNNLTHVNVS
jgi:sensor c-di-GMP phosphodiesterase-like protein